MPTAAETLYARRVMDVQNAVHLGMGPITGVMDRALLSIDEATRPLQTVSTHGQNVIATAVYCAKEHAGELVYRGADKHGLTLCEIAAIHLYTQQAIYSQLNKMLRDRDRTKLLVYFPFLKLLLTALEKLPNYEGVVYRGVKVQNNLKSQYRVGRNLTWWAFSSCTLDGDILSSDTFCGSTGERILFTIRCKNGKDISAYSAYSSEKEILLPPGRVFKVEGCMSSPSDTYLSIINLDEQILPAGVKLIA